MKLKIISMKKSLLVLALLFSLVSFAQSPADKSFPPEELFALGSYYYPEQWDSSQWERDLKKMSEMGIKFTHFAEFAWAMMEPEEGKYDFEWLDRAVSLAEKYGLKVIMCTPTPTPPVWLSKKYPDILFTVIHYSVMSRLVVNLPADNSRVIAITHCQTGNNVFLHNDGNGCYSRKHADAVRVE